MLGYFAGVPLEICQLPAACIASFDAMELCRTAIDMSLLREFRTVDSHMVYPGFWHCNADTTLSILHVVAEFFVTEAYRCFTAVRMMGCDLAQTAALFNALCGFWMRCCIVAGLVGELGTGLLLLVIIQNVLDRGEMNKK